MRLRSTTIMSKRPAHYLYYQHHTIEQTIQKAIQSEDINEITRILYSRPKRSVLALQQQQQPDHQYSFLNSQFVRTSLASPAKRFIQTYDNPNAKFFNWKNLQLYNRQKDNPLHYACRLGKTSLLKVFLESGHFDINDVNNDGDTCLHIAVDCGWIELTQCLISIGANLEHENNKHKTPLILATELISPYDVQMCKLLIEHKANVDRQTRNGNCALLSSSKFGNYELIEDLIHLKANINVKFHDGATSLMRASYYNYTAVVKFLLNHGANIDDLNNRNESALYIASFRGNFEIASILIEYGSNVDCDDIDGDTPLTVACYEDRTEIISLLLMNRANVNKKGIRGDSPLHIASSNCGYPVIKDLIKYNANVDALNNDNETSLHIAAKQNRYDICNLLLQHTKLLNEKTDYGHTPLKCLFESSVIPTKINLAIRLIQCGCDINELKFTINELNVNLIPNFEITFFEYLAASCENTFNKSNNDLRLLVDFFLFLIDSGYKYNFNKDYNLIKNNMWLFRNQQLEAKRQLLLKRMRQPSSLASICRQQIRSLLKTPLAQSIDTLHIPFILKDYLNLK